MTPAVKTAAMGGLVVFVLALSGAQCARSDDRALNPSLRSLDTQGDMETCVAGCAASAKADRQAESSRHVGAVEACADSPDCLQEEAALHVSIIQAINADFQACRAACHNQGSGTGGQ